MPTQSCPHGDCDATLLIKEEDTYWDSKWSHITSIPHHQLQTGAIVTQMPCPAGGTILESEVIGDGVRP